MNILHAALALLATLTLTACGQLSESDRGASPQAAEITLESKAERLSYAIGDGLGKNLRSDQVPLDVEAFAAGLVRAYEDSEALLSVDEIEAEMQAFAKESYDRAIAEREALGKKNLLRGTQFLFANKEKEGVTTLESGVQYRVLKPGEGPIPGEDDIVEVHYRGSSIDGVEFDSSYERGETASFPLSRVIPGWTEALQLMPVGSKWEIVVPPEHAYGEAGSKGGGIGPWETLVFEVELINIVDENAQARQAEPPSSENG